MRVWSASIFTINLGFTDFDGSLANLEHMRSSQLLQWPRVGRRVVPIVIAVSFLVSLELVRETAADELLG